MVKKTAKKRRTPSSAKSSFYKQFWAFAIVFAIMSFFMILATRPDAAAIVDSKVRPGNEGQLVMGTSDVGVILIHGFGASPWEMAPLAEHLSKEGYTVYNMRIAGHGTSVDEFRHTTKEQWYQSVRDAYEVVSSVSGKVYVVGLSLGGELAFQLAEKEDLAGVVSINTPVWLRDKKAKFAPVAKYFIESVHKDLTAEEEPYVYNTRPITAVAELMSLTDEYVEVLGRVDEPVLIIQSDNDCTVVPKSGEYINEHLKSEKQLVLYESGEHSIIRNGMKERLFSDVDAFLKQ